MQAAAYQNGIWVVATRKAGREEGCRHAGAELRHRAVVGDSSPLEGLGGRVVACKCDLALSPYYKSFYDFEKEPPPRALWAADEPHRRRAAE